MSSREDNTKRNAEIVERYEKRVVTLRHLASEYNMSWQRVKQILWEAEGRCTKCGAPARPGRTRCEKHK